MKRLLGFWLLLFQLVAYGQDHQALLTSYDHLLTSFVEEGKVDYSSIAQAKSELDNLSQQFGAVSWKEIEGSSAQKAFLINAYNLFVIKQVVDHYPTNSPQSVSGFFTSKDFLLDGEKRSLNEIEKEIIFKEFPDPRLHFSLVCAAVGCPKLPSTSFKTETLEEQLDDQTRKALSDRSFAFYSKEDNELNISKIFDWYANDFGNTTKERIDYVNSFSNLEVPQNAKVSFIEYDWTLNDIISTEVEATEDALSNLQLFTPSALFTKGEFEVNVFNSIYSQQSIRDDNGDLIDLGQTQNFFTSMIMFTTGVSKTRRFNVGLDLFISKARTVDGEASAFDVFSNSEDAVFNKTLVSYLAPRIKWVPFKSVPRLSIQSALWIPLSNELESDGFVAHDRYTWFTQVFFDKNIGRNFQIFLEADLLYRFKRNENQPYDFFRTPLSAFLSYFPTSNSTIFVFSQYSPRFETTQMDGMEEFGLTQWFAQFGIGGKYQITDALGVEVSYSDFSLSRGEGAGYTVNFGLRYIYR